MTAIIGTVISTVLSLFKSGTSGSAFGSLMPLILAIVVMLIPAGYVGYKYFNTNTELSTEKEQNEQLQKKLETEIKRVTELEASNKANLQYIENLQNDLKLKERLLTEYHDKVRADNKKFDEMITKINVAPESENGQVSKVLSDTLEAIRKDREERMK
jgi:predicted nuclease with TOPRIM domain